MAKREIPPLGPELRAQLEGQRVRVHRNLQNGQWSVTHKGLVVAHTEHVTLRQVSFVVSQAGQRRARSEKQRNVHAWAEGLLVPSTTEFAIERVSYNPFIDAGFHDTSYQLVHQATAVVFRPQGMCMAANLNQLLL